MKASMSIISNKQGINIMHKIGAFEYSHKHKQIPTPKSSTPRETNLKINWLTKCSHSSSFSCYTILYTSCILCYRVQLQ